MAIGEDFQPRQSGPVREVPRALYYELRNA